MAIAVIMGQKSEGIMNLIRYIRANVYAVSGLLIMLNITVGLLVSWPILPSTWLALLVYGIAFLFVYLMKKIVYFHLEIDAYRKGLAYLTLILWIVISFLLLGPVSWLKGGNVFTDFLGIVNLLGFGIVGTFSIILAAPTEKYVESA